MNGFPYVVSSGKLTISEYRTLHYWVEKMLGKPSECVHCGTTENRRYAWANKSGQYLKDINDWERLCYSCHAKKDGMGLYNRKKICKHGHEMTPENTYVKASRPTQRECIACKKILASRWHKLQRINKIKEQS